MCTYKVGLDLVDMLVVTIWWCCTHLIECKGALCYGQAVKSWARVRRSELEKHSTRSQRQKHLHSNFKKNEPQPPPLHCFRPVLWWLLLCPHPTPKKTLRATVDLVFHLSQLTNFFLVCQQPNSMASPTGVTAAAAVAESKSAKKRKAKIEAAANASSEGSATTAGENPPRGGSVSEHPPNGVDGPTESQMIKELNR